MIYAYLERPPVPIGNVVTCYAQSYDLDEPILSQVFYRLATKGSHQLALEAAAREAIGERDA